MNSEGLKSLKSSYGTYSQFLYNSSLAAHMLPVFETRTNEHQNDEQQRTYVAIAILYLTKASTLI